MKRLFYLMLVVLSTVVFTACSDDEDNNNGGDNGNDGNGTITMVTKDDVNLTIYTLNEGDSITIDWGDGSTGTYQSENVNGYNTIEIEHNYLGNSNHTITIQDNKIINYLECTDSYLISLDVSKCTTLIVLDCGYNELSSLDVSGCTALTELECYGNQLTSLNVSKNTALTYIKCNGNQLTSLDVSGCTALTELFCYNNQFTAEGMNDLYKSLPTVEYGILNCAQLGDPSIAEQKGWSISFHNN